MRPRLGAMTFAVLLFLAAGCGDGGRPATPPTPTPSVVPTEETTAAAPTSTPVVADEAEGRIAFTSDRDGNGEVYVINADGSGLTRLTNSPAYDSRPAWSPDGSRIAFVSFRDGNSEVYVMNADGSGQTNLTNSPAEDGFFGLALSSDGSRLAFTSDRDGNDEIYMMNADGSGLARLTNDPADDRFPAWSPAP